MNDEDGQVAVDIITNKISEILNSYATCENEEKSKKMKKQLEILEKIKQEVYLNNTDIIKNVLEKYEKGLL